MTRTLWSVARRVQRHDGEGERDGEQNDRRKDFHSYRSSICFFALSSFDMPQATTPADDQPSAVRPGPNTRITSPVVPGA